MSLKDEEEIQEYIDQLRDAYDLFLLFIDNPDKDAEVDYMNFHCFIDTQEIHMSKELFNHFILILVSVANNHHRQPGFFSKIERILIKYKDSIKQNNTNIEIYEQFESNKRLLYFLIKEQILTIDQQITQLIENKNELNGKKFSDFFLREIPKSDNENDENISYYSENWEEYDKKREIGENDLYICSLIRQDSIEEFVEYLNRTNLSLFSKIKPSIFETNSFLIDKEPTLIEYAAFFGSVQIFQYLYLNKVEVNGNLWLYGIHSNNSDLLRNYIESNHIEPVDTTCQEILNESIKCHHNEIANYIKDNLIDENKLRNRKSRKKVSYDEMVFGNAFKYQNYAFFPTDFDQSYAFYYFYKYNYPNIVDFLITSEEENIKAKIILMKYLFFLMKFHFIYFSNEILKYQIV